ncbi:unnamed protein product [Mycena citricolor]|uniref:Cytochrome P450 n=1 Tax=Mycena citricolor TaxID=2018698 RepID=A0AAD2GR52_9AGAR|nr:unnamed protein product [Mycena citricolor]
MLLLTVGLACPILGYYLPRFLRERQQHTDSLLNIPGPASVSWIYGNMREYLLSPVYGTHEFAWLERFGSVYRIKACFGDHLIVADPAAMQHILTSTRFDYSITYETLLWLMNGPGGIQTVRDAFEGGREEHRRLRAGMNGGFTASVVQSYQPMLERLAHRLSVQIEELACDSLIDVSPLLSRTALGAISEALINRPFETLDEEFIDLNTRIVGISASVSKGYIFADIITSNLPKTLVRWLFGLRVGALDLINRGRESALALGRKFISERSDGDDPGECEGIYGLLRELSSKTLEHHHQLMSSRSAVSGKGAGRTKTLTPEELIAQTSVLLLAGQDTTATTLCFCLIELARNPTLQEQLREEIRARPLSQAYSQMPLLNAVIKETLRMFPVVPFTDRMAFEDDVIPVSRPIVGRDGQQMTEFRVRKGQVLSVSIASYQRIQSVWGEDANEFNPNRWFEGGHASLNEVVGPYANLMSFISGFRTCVG